MYQHVLDFPDGEHVDGEDRVMNSKGLILLFSPAKCQSKSDCHSMSLVNSPG